MKKAFLITGILLAGMWMCSAGAWGADLDIDASSPFIYPEYSKRISMDFQDADLVDVLKIFSQQTKFNLITSEAIVDKRVTVYLDDVPVEQALEQVLRANDLTYEVQPNSNIYIVKELSRPEVELITRVYQLKNASLYSAWIRNTLKMRDDADEEIERDIEIDELGVVAAVKAILTEEGSVVENPQTNSIVVTDIASNFDNIERTIERLDIPMVQILIEVEMLEVSKENSDKIGIKIGDTPLSFTGGQRDHIYPWDQNRKLRQGYTFEEAEYRVGTIDASGLSATLQALKTFSDTKNLARPKILTLNHEPAQIQISTDEAIGVSTNTNASASISTQSVEAERVQTGVFLTVTPQANIDTREITMAVEPKVIIARTGSTFAGTTFRDPEERGSRSILRVRSGDTIIIGGLMRDDVTETVTKVPLAGDIPIIGSMFRHKDVSKKERELIIFITPHILDESYLAKKEADTPKRLLREQQIPNRRLSEMERELSKMDKP